MVDLQDRVLLHHAEEDEDTERGVEVERIAGVPEREKGKGHRQRQGEQDRQGVDQALELGGEDHVHEDEGEEEDPEELGERPLQLARAPGNGGGVAGRQPHLRHRAPQGSDAVGLTKAGEHHGTETNLALPIGAVDAGGGVPRGDLHEIVQADQAVGPGLAALTGDEEARDRAQVAPVLLAEPELHVIVLVAGGVAEARHFRVAPHHEAQRGGDLLGVHAEVPRPLAIDTHAQLGPVEPQRGVGVGDAA